MYGNILGYYYLWLFSTNTWNSSAANISFNIQRITETYDTCSRGILTATDPVNTLATLIKRYTITTYSVHVNSLFVVYLRTGGNRDREQYSMCEWKTNLSLTHISISMQDSWATMSVCSHQNLFHAAHETQQCAQTHNTSTQTDTHTHTHKHGCHTRQRRWRACGRQIHLRSVPAQRVIRELPNQAKACWSRPVLGPRSLAVPGCFFFSTNKD